IRDFHVTGVQTCALPICGGKEQLVVTELPYGISKARVIEQIADLVRTRKTDDIADLRDESDRDGMRIVIELKRGAKPKPVLNLRSEERRVGKECRARGSR